MLPLLGLVVSATALLAACSDDAPPPAAAEPFTVVVIPDTQSYTVDDGLAGTMSVQTRWIRDTRERLGTAFAIHVGDLVESHPNEPMWQRVSSAMQILDDAGVPSSVTTGNHDMDVDTGEAAMFDRYFPPSRYEDNRWTPRTTTYGGHLAERGNQDSFSLFSADGLDFMVLNLEYESPDATLAWAQQVLDAHPDRRVILATHGFVNTDNARGEFTTRADPHLNAAPQVWDELVRNNCNIFLVVNGHWTSRSDPTQGEGRRTDANACGQPVHQVLSNYQGRANGGDGWLRYYTFDPSRDAITARTYSPTLDRFETDADSAFTLDYAMSSPDDDLLDVVVPAGSQWRHRLSDEEPPADWTALGFDATGWRKGPAPLGFGQYGPATDIARGLDPERRPLTAQLRRYVDLDDADALREPRITVQADDGAVVHVNGTEVGRSNMPAGAITSGTYAVEARPHREAVERPVTFAIPPGLLRDGTNVIAVEIHSNYRASPDMTFDLALSALAR